MFEQKCLPNRFGSWPRLVLIGVVLAVCLPPSALGNTQPDTVITSETMTADNVGQNAVFKGSVVLIKGDLKVRSDVMTVNFKTDEPSEETPSGEGSQNDKKKIDSIVAQGKKVIIEKGDGKAICRHAVYYKNEEKMVLTGSPIAWQGGTRVSGPKMTMYLKENRSVVEGGTRLVITGQEGE